MKQLGKVLRFLERPRVRAWLYRVATAAGAVCAGYGWVTGAKLALWVGLLAAVVGSGTAAANTSTRRELAQLEDQADAPAAGRPAARPRKFGGAP